MIDPCPKHPNLTEDELKRSAEHCEACLAWLAAQNYVKMFGEKSLPDTKTSAKKKKRRGRPPKYARTGVATTKDDAIDRMEEWLKKNGKIPKQDHPPKTTYDFVHLTSVPASMREFHKGKRVWVLTYSPVSNQFGVSPGEFFVVDGPLSFKGAKWRSYRIETNSGESRCMYGCNLHPTKESAVEDAALRNAITENCSS